MSSWGADRLSPRIQRAATLTLLERAQRVEMASLEDPEFNRLLESGRLLGALVSTGHPALAAAGTAVVAVRTGAANVGGLLGSVNRLFEKSLYVGDLQKLTTEVERLAIPADLPERPAAIHVEDVSFTYAGRTAPPLDRVSLTIQTGQVVALVGDNGAGKSTLARLLCGLYQPDSGTIRWDGVDTATADRAQQFAPTVLLPQDPFHWSLTLRAIVTAGRPGHHAHAHALALAPGGFQMGGFPGADVGLDGDVRHVQGEKGGEHGSQQSSAARPGRGGVGARHRTRGGQAAQQQVRGRQVAARAARAANNQG
ncbi:ATP-binding cassette domain-containing protein [Kitasatospora sp. NPDC057198]|uniref:ATP-binding cassette domain-containing protein n=1 Tax=Kitasatospora sp. NPDC057198 TaxID=3346046 RepID=UPI003641E5A1